MSGRASPSCRGIASWLVRSLLGVFVMVSAALPAAAQFTFGSGTHEDKNAPILFRADEIQYDEQLALTIASYSPEAVQASLRAVWASREMSPGQMVELGNLFLNLATSAEALRNSQVSFEKRKPAPPTIR